MTTPTDTQPTLASSPGGSIYDLGYQGYHGSRIPRSGVVMALLWQTLRACYGIGRGARAKIVPLALAGIALIPAIVAVGIALLLAQAGPAAARFEGFSPIRYSTYADVIALFVMLFCAAQAPELLGRDQRFGVLPLYFSRALARTDYALARIGGLVAGLALMVLTPQIVLFVGRLLMASDPGAGWEAESKFLLPVLLQSAFTVGLMGGIAAAIASHTPRRAYATAGIIAVLIIPPVIVGLIGDVGRGGFARYAALLSPPDVLAQTNALLFRSLAGTSDRLLGPAAGLPDAAYLLAAVAWIVVTFALTIRRYRRIAV
jgi:ABC-2 type transport system permease protein